MCICVYVGGICISFDFEIQYQSFVLLSDNQEKEMRDFFLFVFQRGIKKNYIISKIDNL